MEMNGLLVSLMRPLSTGQWILSALIIFSIINRLVQARHHELDNSLHSSNLEQKLTASALKDDGKYL